MPPRNILVIRFSAMGDVMLLAPVLQSLVHTYPDLNVTVVTRPRFKPFFIDIPRLTVFEADVDLTYRGISGMFSLCKALLRHSNFDHVFDLHDHLRTMILRTLFRIYGKKVIVFKKGRKEKRAFVRPHNKVTRMLPHTIVRYQGAFLRAGFDFEILPGPFLRANNESNTFIRNWLDFKGLLPKTKKWIGIAPFATHLSKIWPRDYVRQLLGLVFEKGPVHFFLFGGGKDEIAFFESLKEQYRDQCTLVAGQMKIEHEVALLAHLDLMVCVDSSNMHLAALSGTPLLALWGGTHPDVGFGPYRYDPSVILQISREELPCRPCSVYGVETCLRKDFACLFRLTPNLVSTEISRKLGF